MWSSVYDLHASNVHEHIRQAALSNYVDTMLDIRPVGISPSVRLPRPRDNHGVIFVVTVGIQPGFRGHDVTAGFFSLSVSWSESLIIIPWSSASFGVGQSPGPRWYILLCPPSCRV